MYIDHYSLVAGAFGKYAEHGLIILCSQAKPRLFHVADFTFYLVSTLRVAWEVAIET